MFEENVRKIAEEDVFVTINTGIENLTKKILELFEEVVSAEIMK